MKLVIARLEYQENLEAGTTNVLRTKSDIVGLKSKNPQSKGTGSHLNLLGLGPVILHK